ncbi:CD209 antigen-like protein E [Notolabrus celidotus]|uniref:CD209 antigen-like protein E n=1 Tax=Notolabrus celidotus TaxID=1203425 RepID=UPI00148FB1D8|nr:CD209 antigen-like protein E [Notolabrus celidotus]
MEDIYINVDYEKPDDKRCSTYQTGPRSSQRRFHGAVVLFLALLSVLLLATLIGLSVHCHISACNSSAECSTIRANLTEHLSVLTEQRDLLNTSLAEMTKELQCLKKTCPSGWKMFSCSCYLFSTQKKSWEESRESCRAEGADLVVIESFEEQEFLTDNIKDNSWIGLSDRDNEGAWKWTDDTPLTQKFWRHEQPDNGGGDPQWGEEDCVHIRSNSKTDENWNDLKCDNSMLWICEK